MHKQRASIVGLAALGLLLLTSIGTAAAHEHRTVVVNGVTWNMKVGSQTEPPYVDYPNAVQMFVTTTVLVNGTNSTVAVTGLQNYLKVNVTTGAYTITLPFKTVSTDPTQYIAPFIPTVAGTYNYTIFGNINGTYFDQMFSCANGKFECISDPSAVEFPVPAPTQYELANQLSSLNATVNSMHDSPGTSTSTIIGIAGVAIGTVGLIVGASALMISRRKPKA